MKFFSERWSPYPEAVARELEAIREKNLENKNYPMPAMNYWIKLYWRLQFARS